MDWLINLEFEIKKYSQNIKRETVKTKYDIGIKNIIKVLIRRNAIILTA